MKTNTSKHNLSLTLSLAHSNGGVCGGIFCSNLQTRISIHFHTNLFSVLELPSPIHRSLQKAPKSKPNPNPNPISRQEVPSIRKPLPFHSTQTPLRSPQLTLLQARRWRNPRTRHRNVRSLPALFGLLGIGGFAVGR